MNEIEELTRTVEQFADRFIGFKTNLDADLKRDREDREALERKVNMLQIGGLPTNERDPNPATAFIMASKAWNPNRVIDSGFDYSEYRKAFSKYARMGIDSLSMEERKAMQVGVDADGGYLIPTENAREIIRVEYNNSVMRGLARIVPIGTSEMEFPATLTRPETGWVGETGSRNATSTPGVERLLFTAKELYSMPEVTQKLLDDSAFDIDSFINEEIGMAFAEAEDAEFIAGNGILRPRGFTTYPTVVTSDATRSWGQIQHIATGQAGAWPTTDAALYDKLVDVVHALKPGYRRNAKWVMGTEAITRIRKMKTATTSEPMWQPSLIDGQPDRLLGYPVAEAEQMPAIAADSLSVAFADWRRAYWICDRLGIRMLRDPYTNKPYVRFYTTKRTTGGVADTKAIKLLKFSAT